MAGSGREDDGKTSKRGNKDWANTDVVERTAIIFREYEGRREKEMGIVMEDGEEWGKGVAEGTKRGGRIGYRKNKRREKGVKKV